MSGIPRAVLSDTLRQHLAERRVTASVFTTYTFEPQFFEEEILSLLSDQMVSAEPKLRMLQLEELLRSNIGPVAVYYDRGGLRGEGAARLDVRRTPVHVKTGVFHPKVVLLLTMPEDASNTKVKPALICGVLSSNLTKGGWWSNLECAHFETIYDGDRCSFRDDLRSMIRQLRALCDAEVDHEALDAVQAFLTMRVSGVEHATLNGRLRPRLLAGKGSLTNFLELIRGSQLSGTTLEVISPFFDKNAAAPLRKLLEKLQLRNVTVFLARNTKGEASCSEAVYQDVIEMGARWAQFRGEEELLRLGKDKKAKARSVHAKVYRFTEKAQQYEALVVGSHNLTSPATMGGQNFEASFFVELASESHVHPWLQTDEKRPKTFAVLDPELESCEPRDDVAIPLQVRFNWSKPLRCALRWDGQSSSPALTISLHGAKVFACASLTPGAWQELSPTDTSAFQEKLISSALLSVQLDDGSSGTILVQEEGMSFKPSILLTLSPTEILAYWSRLTVNQRVEYLEERLGGIDAASLRAEGIKLLDSKAATSMFETYAGIFHGFEMLRERVHQSLEEGFVKNAEYLLFGERHDSLPRMLQRVQQNEEKTDPVSRYLMILSARQLVRWLRRTHKEFVAAHAVAVADLARKCRETSKIREELSVGPDHVKFLDWFEGHFLSRRVAVASNA